MTTPCQHSSREVADLRKLFYLSDEMMTLREATVWECTSCGLILPLTDEEFETYLNS